MKNGFAVLTLCKETLTEAIYAAGDSIPVWTS